MTWSDDILVGHPLIDAQHRRIWEEVQELRRAPQRAVGSFLEFFPDHAASHFGLEEQLMVDARYPKLEEHSRKHTAFFDTFVHLRARYLLTGSSESLHAMVDAMAGWIKDHVAQHDLEMAKWLREHPPHEEGMALPGY